MTRVACLMMQTDEDLLLRPWLAYHGYLFGFENLYVFDDLSTDPGVLGVLEEFAALGVHVESGDGGFAAIVADCARRFREADQYDVVLALDCSQFVLIDGPDGIGCHRTHIEREIERLDREGEGCRMTACLRSRPGFVDLYDWVGFDRRIFVLGANDQISDGSAAAERRAGPDRPSTSLICVDMTGRPFNRVLAAASRQLARADGERPERFGVLAMTPGEYYRDGLGAPRVLVRFRGLVRLLRTLMRLDDFVAAWEAGRPGGLLKDVIEVDLDEVPFRSASYLEMHPDATGPGGAFGHFIGAGFLEGRPIDASRAGKQEMADRAIRIAAWKGDGVGGYNSFANIFMAAGRSAEADRHLTDAIARFGKTELLLTEHALAAMHQAEFETATARWEICRSHYPEASMGYAFGALAFRLAGKLDQAEQLATAGLARFPSDFLMLDVQGQIASARGDWALSLRILRDLVARFPEHRPLLRDRLIDAEFQMRVQALDGGSAAEDDALAAPVAVAMNEAETRQALDAFGFHDVAQLRAFFLNFESLGFSCEFGLVQRRYGAEPISLLRWNSVQTVFLIEMLEEGFAGLDDPGNLFALSPHGEYILCDRKYDSRMHSFVYNDGLEIDVFMAKQVKRISYLKRKLIGDLHDGKKIFVHLGSGLTESEDLRRLRVALRRFSTAARLLTVTVAERPTDVGRVEVVGDDCLGGYIARLGGSAGGWDIDFSGWVSVCRAAIEHWQTVAPRAAEVA